MGSVRGRTIRQVGSIRCAIRSLLHGVRRTTGSGVVLVCMHSEGLLRMSVRREIPGLGLWVRTLRDDLSWYSVVPLLPFPGRSSGLVFRSLLLLSLRRLFTRHGLRSNGRRRMHMMRLSGRDVRRRGVLGESRTSPEPNGLAKQRCVMRSRIVIGGGMEGSRGGRPRAGCYTAGV